MPNKMWKCVERDNLMSPKKSSVPTIVMIAHDPLNEIPGIPIAYLFAFRLQGLGLGFTSIS